MSRPYGLLGRHLGHTYSPIVHRELAGLEFVKFEREPKDFEAFLRGDEWEGLNVTLPYKQEAAKVCDRLTPLAERLGNVNTITRTEDGELLGDNTDYVGFMTMAETLGIELEGIKAVVFGGSGGAGSTVIDMLEHLGAKPVSISRKGPDNYGNLERHADAKLAVNCTPVGMYPNCPASVCSLESFPELEGFMDATYNPARTGLYMQAEQMGIPRASGMLMLVAQAAATDEIFTGDPISLPRVFDITARLSATEQNIALMGLPGSGKTVVGEELARIMGRRHVDINHALEMKLGMKGVDYIRKYGEESFRLEETELLEEVSKRSRLVISCTNGTIMREENYPLLHQNSLIVFLNRPLEKLYIHGRQLAGSDELERYAQQTTVKILEWADYTVDSFDSIEQTAQGVLNTLPVMLVDDDEEEEWGPH